MKKKADYHVLRLFIPKKYDLSKKKFRLARAVVARKLKFWLLEYFEPT
jgi:hypothetical protein